MDTSLDLPERPTEDAAVNLANHLLKQFRIPTRIINIEDISSSLFVVLYESLFSDQLQDIIRQPVSKDDDIHNCQIVIDVLSSDVIHDSLSHIRGVDIVAGDLTSIYNLLDIFSHLLEYVIKKIESDHDETRSVLSLETNSQTSTPSKKTATNNSRKVLHEKSGQSQTHSNISRDKKVAAAHGPEREASLNKNENRKAYDDHKIISHEEFYAMTYGGLSKHGSIQPLSPIRPDRSQSLLGQKTVDSEFETDTEKMFDPLATHPKIVWDNQQEFAREHHHDVARATTPTQPPAATATATSSLSAATAGLSATVPAASKTASSDSQQPLRSTIGPVTYSTHPAPQEARDARTSEPKNLSSYYKDLKELVKTTATMTKLALEASPVRTKLNKNMDEVDEPASIYASGGTKLLAQELHIENPYSRAAQSPGGKKKVAFASSQFDVKGQGSSHLGKYLHDLWRQDGLGTVCQAHHVEQGCEPNDIESLSVQVTHKKSKSPRCHNQTKRLAKHLANNRQAELGAAHLVLKNEDLKIRKKYELLHEFYERDCEEFAEDVDYMLGRELEKAAETEEKYVQKCAEAAARKKGTQKAKDMSSQTVHRKPKKKVTRHKVMEEERKEESPPATVTLESEEDLLPFLMEEFPYLHLSEHTWHELWRKGLHQIEALTRAYKEIERKKSRAQSQLSEAAERHGLLSEIMRKQLEHSRRLQELKEQKQQQIKMRNKNHEKRIQSARARRYYNEYQVRARAKVLKRRTKEEMVFRELFKEALNIQRERVKDIRKYASDQRRRQEQQRQNEIDSLENFYHNQFEMLAERLAREHLETRLRDAAQNQMMERMKRELRNKMEAEIKQYQEQIIRNDDDAYFRQADAERLKDYLHTAHYPVKI